MVKDSTEQSYDPKILAKQQRKKAADALYWKRKKAGLVKAKVIVPGLKTVGAGASELERNRINCKNYRLR